MDKDKVRIHRHENETKSFGMLLKQKVENINNFKMPMPFWDHQFFIHHLPKPIPHPKLCIRKNQADMTTEEKETFKCAYSTVISAGFLGPYVAIHSDMSHRMHSMSGPVGRERFLPWHRVYLLELEIKLMAYHPSICLPYWDWVNEREIPEWLENFKPTMIVNGNPVTVVRNPGSPASLPHQPDVDAAMSQTTYTNFTQDLEGIHNGVHVWVGGTMSFIATAPADPIFWLHHANIDRIWDMWQGDNLGENPTLAGSDATMDPWMSFDEIDTRSISGLGYVYA